MPSLTTNFSLNKPLVNNATDQDLWGGYTNTNWDTVDTQLLLCRDFKKRTITGTDSVVAGDRHKILLCDATSAAFTLTMLLAASAADGFTLTIVKTDATANAVTLDGSGSELIGGAATFALSGQGDAATLVCDGTGWNFQGNKTTPSAVASASTTSQGIIEIATNAEVLAGSDSARAIVPSALAALVTATTSGKADLVGGVTLQWGKYTGGSNNPTVSFGTTFSNTPYSIIAQHAASSLLSTVLWVNTVSTSSFKCDQRNSSSGGTQTGDFFWLAIGPT